MDIQQGDLLLMKKPHPCGAREMRVLRAGMEFRLCCVGCGREFLVPRIKIEKSIRKISRPDGSQ